MLDMGFLPQMKTIMNYVPEQRQSMCFSATLDRAVAHLVHDYLKNPLRIEVDSMTKPAESVILRMYEVPEDQTNMIPGKYRVGERAKSNVFPVQYSIEPLVGQNHGDPELYTALDNIAEPSVTSMMQAMKNAREQSLVEKADLMEFDYSKVGPEMLKIIQSYKIQREEIKRGLAEDKQLVEEVFGEQEEVTDV